MSVPTPVRGRPSTSTQTPPAPIPYADLRAEQRSSSLADGLPVRVGTVTDIVTSWLPTQKGYRNEELCEEERRMTAESAGTAGRSSFGPASRASLLIGQAVGRRQVVSGSTRETVMLFRVVT
jgi:hypothetical protein